jgi:hypothetical protein
MPAAVQAKLTDFVIEQRIDVPAAGTTPPYLILRGHYRGALRPSDPRNAIITDLDRADRLPDGRVGYRATFAIAMPGTAARQSGFLLYDVPNRSNGDVAPDPDGHIRVVSGWQGDIASTSGLQTLEVPIARHADGGPITGPILQRFTSIDAGTNTIAIGGGIGRPTPRPLPVTLDTRAARLFRQASDRAAPIDCRSDVHRRCFGLADLVLQSAGLPQGNSRPTRSRVRAPVVAVVRSR